MKKAIFGILVSFCMVTQTAEHEVNYLEKKAHSYSLPEGLRTVEESFALIEEDRRLVNVEDLFVVHAHKGDKIIGTKVEEVDYLKVIRFVELDKDYIVKHLPIQNYKITIIERQKVFEVENSKFFALLQEQHTLLNKNFKVTEIYTDKEGFCRITISVQL